MNIFRVFLYLNFDLIQRMAPKWTFRLQFLRITPETFFSNLIDLLMSSKIFINNNDIKKFFFRMKTEQKVKKWKDSVSSIHFGNRNFSSAFNYCFRFWKKIPSGKKRNMLLGRKIVVNDITCLFLVFPSSAIDKLVGTQICLSPKYLLPG